MRTRPCSSPKPAGALNPVVPKTTSQPGGGRHARTSPAPPSGARARGPGRGRGGAPSHRSRTRAVFSPTPPGGRVPARPSRPDSRTPAAPGCPRAAAAGTGQGAGTPAGLGAGSPQRTATPSRRPRSKRGLESPSLSRRCSDVCGGLGPARPPSARETPAGLRRGTSCRSAEFLSPRGARGVCLENLALIPSVCLNLISKEA